VQVHLVQLDIVWEDKEQNYARVRGLLKSVKIAAGDLVALPEMFDTGFSLLNPGQTADGKWDVTEPQRGPGGTMGKTLEFLRQLALELNVTVHGSRTLVDAESKGRNMASVVGPDGEVLVEYAKIHPFSYGKETERFVGGTQVLTYPWTHNAGEPVTICPAICYDLRFPELFRLGLKAGAEMIVIGANWPAPRAYHWRSLLIARAIENQAVVVGVNRAGKDLALAYGGGSIVVGPKGEVLGEMDDREGVLSVEVDAGAIREWRKTFPAWRDLKL